MLHEELRTAVEQGRVVALFQPQVDVRTRRIVAAEALARLHHPTEGLLAPDRFIPLAERGRAIHDIGRRMLHEGWRTAERMLDAGLPIDIAVNVSAQQLADAAFPDRVAELLDRATVPPGTMTLEITESYAILDVPGVARRLRHLRDLGVGVSIDDFGVGYSSMDRVEELPVTEIKVDISMVQDMSDAGYGAFLEIVEYAHSRSIRVVAEGVETEDQLRRVEALRCQRAQGWLFGQPVPEDELVAQVMRRQISGT